MQGQAGAPKGEWRTYGGDLGHTRYAPLDQITAGNFSKLEVAWRFKTDNLGPRLEFNLQSTPLVVGSRLYSTGGTRRAVVSLDAATGELLWVHSEDEGARGAAAPRQLSGRGLAYWTDGKEERILYVTQGYRLVALDARTGNRVPSFGSDGILDLKADLDRSIDLDHRSSRPACDAHRRGRHRPRRRRVRDRRQSEEQEQHQRRRAGVRRANRQAALDVQDDSRAGRGRRRDVGRRLVGLHRQHRRVGADLGRSRARDGVPPGRDADARLLRRRAPGERTVRRDAGRRRSENRSAQVALPARAPRHLGHGHPVRADPRRHHRERENDQSGRAADQAGVPLCVRPGDWSADLADRREAGAARRHARREVFEDAADPEQARGL